MKQTVDLSKCRKGDRLRMRNGKVCKFSHHIKNCDWTCEIVCNGDEMPMRTNDGFTFTSKVHFPEDIIAVLPRKRKPRKALGQVAYEGQVAADKQSYYAAKPSCV